MAGHVMVTTECTCETLDDVTDEYEQSDYCYGDCSEWQWEDACYLIDEWAKRWDTNGIRVDARGMGWTGADAYAEVTFSGPEDVLRLFTIGGDYRLELSVSEAGEFTVRRYSHDEPMGCSMVAVPISEWE